MYLFLRQMHWFSALSFCGCIVPGQTWGMTYDVSQVPLGTYTKSVLSSSEKNIYSPSYVDYNAPEGKVGQGVNLLNGRPAYSVPIAEVSTPNAGLSWGFSLNYSAPDHDVASAPANENSQWDAGLGWSFSLPFIATDHRGTASHHDDVFHCNLGPLGGGQLVLAPGGKWFHPLRNPSVRVTPFYNTDEVIQYWKVDSPDSIHMYFGFTDNSRRNTIRTGQDIRYKALIPVDQSGAGQINQPYPYRWDLGFIVRTDSRDTLKFRWKKLTTKIDLGYSQTSTSRSTSSFAAFLDTASCLINAIASVDGVTMDSLLFDFDARKAKEIKPPNFPDQLSPRTGPALSKFQMFRMGTEISATELRYRFQTSNTPNATGWEGLRFLTDVVTKANGYTIDSLAFSYDESIGWIRSVTNREGGRQTWKTKRLKPISSGLGVYRTRESEDDYLLTNPTSCDEYFCYSHMSGRYPGQVVINKITQSGLKQVFDTKSLKAEGAFFPEAFERVTDGFVVTDRSRGKVRLFQWNGTEFKEQYPFAGDPRYSTGKFINHNAYTRRIVSVPPYFVIEDGGSTGTCKEGGREGLPYDGNNWGCDMRIRVVAGPDYFVVMNWASHSLNGSYVSSTQEMIPVVLRNGTWTSINRNPTACDFHNKETYSEPVRNISAGGCLEWIGPKAVFVGTASGRVGTLEQRTGIFQVFNRTTNGFISGKPRMRYYPREVSEFHANEVNHLKDYEPTSILQTDKIFAATAKCDVCNNGGAKKWVGFQWDGWEWNPVGSDSWTPAGVTPIPIRQGIINIIQKGVRDWTSLEGWQVSFQPTPVDGSPSNETILMSQGPNSNSSSSIWVAERLAPNFGGYASSPSGRIAAISMEPNYKTIGNGSPEYKNDVGYHWNTIKAKFPALLFFGPDGKSVTHANLPAPSGMGDSRYFQRFVFGSETKLYAAQWTRSGGDMNGWPCAIGASDACMASIYEYNLVNNTNKKIWTSPTGETVNNLDLNLVGKQLVASYDNNGVYYIRTIPVGDSSVVYVDSVLHDNVRISGGYGASSTIAFTPLHPILRDPLSGQAQFGGMKTKVFTKSSKSSKHQPIGMGISEFIIDPYGDLVGAQALSVGAPLRSVSLDTSLDGTVRVGSIDLGEWGYFNDQSTWSPLSVLRLPIKTTNQRIIPNWHTINSSNNQNGAAASWWFSGVSGSPNTTPVSETETESRAFSYSAGRFLVEWTCPLPLPDVSSYWCSVQQTITDSYNRPMVVLGWKAKGRAPTEASLATLDRTLPLDAATQPTAVKNLLAGKLWAVSGTYQVWNNSNRVTSVRSWAGRDELGGIAPVRPATSAWPIVSQVDFFNQLGQPQQTRSYPGAGVQRYGCVLWEGQRIRLPVATLLGSPCDAGTAWLGEDSLASRMGRDLSSGSIVPKWTGVSEASSANGAWVDNSISRTGRGSIKVSGTSGPRISLNASYLKATGLRAMVWIRIPENTTGTPVLVASGTDNTGTLKSWKVSANAALIGQWQKLELRLTTSQLSIFATTGAKIAVGFGIDGGGTGVFNADDFVAIPMTALANLVAYDDLLRPRWRIGDDGLYTMTDYGARGEVSAVRDIRGRILSQGATVRTGEALEVGQ